MYTYNKSIKKVRDEDDLFRDLHKHCDVLDNGIIRYLEALIKLELNVVREGISGNDREILAQLSLFKDISTYNIYHLSQNVLKDLLEHHKLSYIMKNNLDCVSGVETYLRTSRRKFQVFDFDYSGRTNEISLFKLEDFHKVDDEYLSGLIQENPYPVSNEKAYLAFEEEQRRKIVEYDEMINKNLTVDDRNDIELARRIYECLLSEFGVEDDEFREVEYKSDFRKTYVKIIPGLHIKKSINYI